MGSIIEVVKKTEPAAPKRGALQEYISFLEKIFRPASPKQPASAKQKERKSA